METTMNSNDEFCVLVRKMLSYDPTTGYFTWLVSRSKGRAGATAGTRHHQGYVRLKFAGHTVFAHRLAWLVTHGHWPTGEIDHINGDRADNRIANLRDVTKANNQRNRLKPLGANPYPNVQRDGNRWTAAFKVSRKTRWVGSFETPEAARAAVVLAKSRLL